MEKCATCGRNPKSYTMGSPNPRSFGNYCHCDRKDTETQMLEALAEETLPAELDPDQKET